MGQSSSICQTSGQVTHVACALDVSSVIALAGEKIEIFNAETANRKQVIAVPKVSSFIYDAETHFLVVGTRDGQSRVFKLTASSCKLAMVLPEPEKSGSSYAAPPLVSGPVSSVAVLAPCWLLAGGYDGVTVWDVENRTSIGVINTGSTSKVPVSALCVLPQDGLPKVLVGSNNGRMVCCDVGSKQTTLEYMSADERPAHAGKIHAIQRMENELVVSAAGDGTLKTWDALGMLICIHVCPGVQLTVGAGDRLILGDKTGKVAVASFSSSGVQQQTPVAVQEGGVVTMYYDSHADALVTSSGDKSAAITKAFIANQTEDTDIAEAGAVPEMHVEGAEAVVALPPIRTEVERHRAVEDLLLDDPQSSAIKDVLEEGLKKTLVAAASAVDASVEELRRSTSAASNGLDPAAQMKNLEQQHVDERHALKVQQDEEWARLKKEMRAKHETERKDLEKRCEEARRKLLDAANGMKANAADLAAQEDEKHQNRRKDIVAQCVKDMREARWNAFPPGYNLGEGYHIVRRASLQAHGFLGVHVYMGEELRAVSIRVFPEEYNELQLLSADYANPNVVGIQHVIRADNTYVILPAIQTLAEHVPEFGFLGPEISTSTEMIRQILNGVAFLHDNGMVHGAVSPDTVYLDNGVYKITHLDALESPLKSWSGMVYTAPEVWLTGATAVAGSDVWAVCCVWMDVGLSSAQGVRVFQGDTPWEALVSVTQVLGVPSFTALEKLAVNVAGDSERLAVLQRVSQLPEKTVGLAHTFPGVPIDIIATMEQMLAFDVDDRITARATLELPLFAS